MLMGWFWGANRLMLDVNGLVLRWHYVGVVGFL